MLRRYFIALRLLAAQPSSDSSASPVPMSNIPINSPRLKASPSVRRAETIAITGVPSTERLASQAGTRSSRMIHNYQQNAVLTTDMKARMPM